MSPRIIECELVTGGQESPPERHLSLAREQVPNRGRCHAPPRALRTPRAFNAAAIPSSAAILAARISLGMGSTLAAKWSARD